MSADPEDAADKAGMLRKLAEDVEVVAEVTADPHGRRGLQFIALAYERLAEFVRTSAGTPVTGVQPPRTSAWDTSGDDQSAPQPGSNPRHITR